jgi:hypothetical protein
MLELNVRWVIWSDVNGKYLHIQIGGHIVDRPYGTVFDIHTLKPEVLATLVEKNDTHSYNDPHKPYTRGVLSFDGSPYVQLTGFAPDELLVPVPLSLFIWLRAEAATQIK